MDNICLQMNYQKLQNKNIKDLLETLNLLNIKIEFDCPEKIEQLSEIFGKKCFVNYLEDLNRRATRVILFEIDVQEKSTVSCGAYLNSQYSIIFPEYQRFVRKHLNVLRKLLGTYSVLDVDGLNLISWKGSSHFDDQNLEGFSYFLPYRPMGDKNYGKSILDQENIKKFYLNSGISNLIANYFIDHLSEGNFYPHYATFSVNEKLPVKYGFSCCIDDGLFKFVNNFYNKYEDLDVLLDFLSKYFYKNFASIQFSTLNHESFSIEIGMNILRFREIIQEILDSQQYLKLCGLNIKELKVPNFITTVIIKFKWESQFDKNVKIYMETDNKEILDEILL